MSKAHMHISCHKIDTQKTNQKLKKSCYNSSYHNLDLLKPELIIKNNHLMF